MTLHPVTTSPAVLQTYLEKPPAQQKVIDQKLLTILNIYSKQLQNITISPTRNNYELNLWFDNYGSVTDYAGPHTYYRRAPQIEEPAVPKKEEPVIKKSEKKLSKLEKKEVEDKEAVVRKDEFPEVKEKVAQVVLKNDPVERRVIIKFGSQKDKNVVVEMDDTKATVMNLIEFAVTHFNPLITRSLSEFHTKFVNEITNELGLAKKKP